MILGLEQFLGLKFNRIRLSFEICCDQTEFRKKSIVIYRLFQPDFMYEVGVIRKLILVPLKMADGKKTEEMVQLGVPYTRGVLWHKEFNI